MVYNLLCEFSGYEATLILLEIDVQELAQAKYLSQMFTRLK